MEEKSEQNQTNTSQQSESAESKTQESSVSHSQQLASDQSSEAKSSSQTIGEKEEASSTKSRVRPNKIEKKRKDFSAIVTRAANPIKPSGDLIPKYSKEKNISDGIYDENRLNIVNKVADQNQQTNKDSIPNISDGISSDENEFDYVSTDWLNTRLQIIHKEIKTKIKEDENLTEKIDEIVDELNLTTFGSNQRALKKERQQYEKEREICRELRQSLEQQSKKIQKELAERAKRKDERPKDSDKISSISANSLFQGNDSVLHTILYVVTFFPDLSPTEFKYVVSLFLRGLTIEKTKQQKIIEEDKTRIIETTEEHSLVAIWEKTFSQPDQYLEKCFIIVRKQENASLVIDFSLPYLRNDLKKYFEEKQFVYVAERLKQVPLLLFDNSENVADRAIDLMAQASIAYPNIYNTEWLLGITEAVEGINDERLFKRLSKLIYQMQISLLEPSKSKQLIETFFNRLLLAERRYAFGIVLHLIFRYLCSTWLFNRIELSKHLLNWLKQVLDEEIEQSNEHDKIQQNKNDVYDVLYTLLEQEKSSDYIYDFLEIFKDWLPEKETSPEDYTSSNQLALSLIAVYYQETISNLNSSDYGKWPSNYPLFASFTDDSDSRCNLKLGILASWLFYSDSDTTLGKNRERNLIFQYVLNIQAIDWIGFLIAEWFIILYGQNNDRQNTSKLTASDVANSLLKQMIFASEPLEQKRLNEYWARLANAYLDEAEKCSKSGEEQLKKEFVLRRKLVRDLRQRFQHLQREVLTEDKE